MSSDTDNHKKISPPEIESLMDECLALALHAAAQGEVPVGALIWKDGAIIAKAHNEIESRNDATAHAEVLAIQKASKILDNWRLHDCILCVTLEPCSMCAGAIIQSRIPTVLFGAHDPKLGAFGSTYDLSTLFPLRVIQGIKEKENLALLRDFFASVRNDSN